MNERLEKEWEQISSIQQLIEGKVIWTEEQVKELAQHFYNLALEDVDKYVESLTTNAHEMPDNHPGKLYCIGVDNTVEQVLDFLDQLSK